MGNNVWEHIKDKGFIWRRKKHPISEEEKLEKEIEFWSSVQKVLIVLLVILWIMRIALEFI